MSTYFARRQEDALFSLRNQTALCAGIPSRLIDGFIKMTPAANAGGVRKLQQLVDVKSNLLVYGQRISFCTLKLFTVVVTRGRSEHHILTSNLDDGALRYMMFSAAAAAAVPEFIDSACQHSVLEVSSSTCHMFQHDLPNFSIQIKLYMLTPWRRQRRVLEQPRGEAADDEKGSKSRLSGSVSTERKVRGKHFKLGWLNACWTKLVFEIADFFFRLPHATFFPCVPGLNLKFDYTRYYKI